MKFSIITATYNSEKTLARAIESVMAQNYSDIEHIIIDGNSTDKTIDIIEEYEKKYSGKIKWISEPDDGIYDAINKGIDLSSGDIIGILGSDDWYEADIFGKIAAEFSKSNALKVVYGLVNIYSNNIQVETSGKHHNNLKNSTLSHQSCFILKKIHEKYGKYNTSYKIAADYDFLLRIAGKEDVSFVNLNVPLANYSHGGVSSNGLLCSIESERAKYENGLISRNRYLKSIIKAKIKKFIRL